MNDKNQIQVLIKQSRNWWERIPNFVSNWTITGVTFYHIGVDESTLIDVYWNVKCNFWWEQSKPLYSLPGLFFTSNNSWIWIYTMFARHLWYKLLLRWFSVLACWNRSRTAHFNMIPIFILGRSMRVGITHFTYAIKVIYRQKFNFASFLPCFSSYYKYNHYL